MKSSVFFFPGGTKLENYIKLMFYDNEVAVSKVHMLYHLNL